MTHIRDLTSIGPRVKGSPGDAKSSDYVADAFAKAGCTVERQPFAVAVGGRSENQLCRFAKADYAAGYVLIGGHRDTVPGSPGANDNASGVGLIISLAKSISNLRLPVELVAFGAEEYDAQRQAHHEGSLAYVAERNPSNITAMISVDMIGNGSSVYVVRDRARSATLQKELLALAAQLNIPTEERAEGQVSDHTSFSRRGVFSALLWSGKHPSYHSSSDTIGVVDHEAVSRSGELTLEWILRRYSI